MGIPLHALPCLALPCLARPCASSYNAAAAPPFEQSCNHKSVLCRSVCRTLSPAFRSSEIQQINASSAQVETGTAQRSHPPSTPLNAHRSLLICSLRLATPSSSVRSGENLPSACKCLQVPVVSLCSPLLVDGERAPEQRRSLVAALRLVARAIGSR